MASQKPAKVICVISHLRCQNYGSLEDLTFPLTPLTAGGPGARPGASWVPKLPLIGVNSRGSR